MKKLIYLTALLAVLFVGKSFAQPGFTIHAYGGYDLPLPDFKGTYPGDLVDDPPRYFQKWGLNIGADAKYFIGKPNIYARGRHFGIVLSLNYHNFTSGEIAVTGDSTFGYTGNYKSEFNVFSLGLGGEYHVRPNEMFNPFFGAEATVNMFRGKVKITPTGGSLTEYEQDTETRMGFALGTGVDLSFQRNFGMVIGVKYHLANVVGKDTNSSFTEPHLNDGKTATHGPRLISWIGFYIGASIYFDRPKGTKSKNKPKLN